MITGAASGIGKETARHLAATHRVALLDRNEDRLQTLSLTWTARPPASGATAA